jgi:hypothetical protein
MKYALLLILCLPLLASAQTPVITSGKYEVRNAANNAVKERGNQADAKKYAAKLYIECKQCDVVIDQPDIRYTNAASSSSSAASSSKAASSVSSSIPAGLVGIEFGRPLAFKNGQEVFPGLIKQHWLTRELNGAAKNESIKPSGDVIIYYTTPPLQGETWKLTTEIYSGTTTVHCAPVSVQL